MRVLSRLADNSMFGLQQVNMDPQPRCRQSLLLQRSRKSSDPAIVALEGASQYQLLSHIWECRIGCGGREGSVFCRRDCASTLMGISNSKVLWEAAGAEQARFTRPRGAPEVEIDALPRSYFSLPF